MVFHQQRKKGRKGKKGWAGTGYYKQKIPNILPGVLFSFSFYFFIVFCLFIAVIEALVVIGIVSVAVSAHADILQDLSAAGIARLIV